ncbi:hypothetical protein L484_023092 [Morus notabilis]|uniref:Uncharacterized protein n=1 Tax=Morus notabilis TaxID=981085 RepID=W9RL89_9ROSA|nr:hypothetical protein L484_023092 [Morus notabilis]
MIWQISNFVKTQPKFTSKASRSVAHDNPERGPRALSFGQATWAGLIPVIIIWYDLNFRVGSD